MFRALVISVVFVNGHLRFCPPIQSNGDPSSGADCMYFTNDTTENGVARSVSDLLGVELDRQPQGSLGTCLGHLEYEDLPEDDASF